MNGTEHKRAIILLSGGLDSATTAAMARAEGFGLYALTFRYGQRHQVEIKAACRVVERLGVEEHKIIEIDISAFGGSALTDDIEVPKGRSLDQMEQGIPVTYVPARNTIFLSYALAFAEVTGAGDIFLGINAVDYSGYPDCRPDYIEAFQKMANLGTRLGVEARESGQTGIRIQVPLIHMSKVDIIKKASELGVDLSITTSCYDPDEDGAACGDCDACILRRNGFEDAGLADPTLYQN